jgi:hypothetical protein
VVPLRRDVPVRTTKGRPPDERAVERLAQRHNLKGSAGRLLQALHG